MVIHYLYSDRRVVASATIRFNGEVQKHCTLVDDKKGYIVRRKFKNGAIDGSETLYGDVHIELPAGVKGGPYTTPAR